MTVLSKELIEKVIDQGGLKESKDLKEAFLPFVDQAQEWMAQAQTLKVESEDEVEKMEQAKTAHRELRKIHNAIEAQRKEFKQESLNKGRAIDAIAKEFQGLIEPVTTFLKEQADYAVIQQEKREQELRLIRNQELTPYRNFVPPGSDTGKMSEEDYGRLLKTVKAMKKMAEEEEEQERLQREEERKEAERIRLENAELQKKLREQELKNQELKKAAEPIVFKPNGLDENAQMKQYLNSVVTLVKSFPEINGKQTENFKGMVSDILEVVTKYQNKL